MCMQALLYISFVYASGCSTPAGDVHDENYRVPSLADLGKKASECGPRLYPGGETEALERMERHLKKTVIQMLLLVLVTHTSSE